MVVCDGEVAVSRCCYCWSIRLLWLRRPTTWASSAGSASGRGRRLRGRASGPRRAPDTHHPWWVTLWAAPASKVRRTRRVWLWNYALSQFWDRRVCVCVGRVVAVRFVQCAVCSWRMWTFEVSFLKCYLGASAFVCDSMWMDLIFYHHLKSDFIKIYDLWWIHVYSILLAWAD